MKDFRAPEPLNEKARKVLTGGRDEQRWIQLADLVVRHAQGDSTTAQTVEDIYALVEKDKLRRIDLDRQDAP